MVLKNCFYKMMLYITFRTVQTSNSNLAVDDNKRREPIDYHGFENFVFVPDMKQLGFSENSSSKRCTENHSINEKSVCCDLKSNKKHKSYADSVWGEGSNIVQQIDLVCKEPGVFESNKFEAMGINNDLKDVREINDETTSLQAKSIEKAALPNADDISDAVDVSVLRQAIKELQSYESNILKRSSEWKMVNSDTLTIGVMRQLMIKLQVWRLKVLIKRLQQELMTYSDDIVVDAASSNDETENSQVETNKEKTLQKVDDISDATVVDAASSNDETSNLQVETNKEKTLQKVDDISDAIVVDAASSNDETSNLQVETNKEKILQKVDDISDAIIAGAPLSNDYEVKIFEENPIIKTSNKKDPLDYTIRFTSSCGYVHLFRSDGFCLFMMKSEEFKKLSSEDQKNAKNIHKSHVLPCKVSISLPSLRWVLEAATANYSVCNFCPFVLCQPSDFWELLPEFFIKLNDITKNNEWLDKVYHNKKTEKDFLADWDLIKGSVHSRKELVNFFIDLFGYYYFYEYYFIFDFESDYLMCYTKTQNIKLSKLSKTQKEFEKAYLPIEIRFGDGTRGRLLTKTETYVRVVITRILNMYIDTLTVAKRD